ncbi:MAG: acyl-[acyl-carrier-protein]--UDP-N-acetylglucosamine O-acyltransferase, partial [Betaproteobacteria bacterium]|nr:acyl-[acyl-carrier-protein]--UDP-N-acetylglucosamine O-acyltransferase [Betaproteobacteria bacterium]
NVEGLRRRGFGPEQIAALKQVTERFTEVVLDWPKRESSLKPDWVN